MITVISGSNRRKSECRRFAFKYAEFLRRHTREEVRFLALEEIEHDWFHPDMYDKEGLSESMTRIQDEYMVPADKFVFVTPEYNGSFPGSVKLFLDACSVRKYAETFKGKRAALVGIASGRAGNLLGMDHLSAVLNHVGIVVMPQRLPISRIEQLTDAEGEITDVSTLAAMEKHALAFTNF